MSETMQYGLEFSTPRIVMTKRGERRVISAAPTPEFWDAWRADKAAVKAAGFSVSQFNGEWNVTRWEETISDAERAAQLQASRAQDAAIDIPIPDGLKLLPYQKAGVAYGMSRPATLIADEMGLGKTVQAIAIANTSGAKSILVIAPASLLSNWRNEINRWQTIGLPVRIVRAGGVFPPLVDAQWVVINYDIAHRYPQIKNNEWDLVILDECHVLKNPNAKRTRFIMGGRAKGEQPAVPAIKAKRRVLLTGTPICNRPKEAYTILHYLDPGRWSTKSSFERRYCDAHNNGFGYDANGASRLDELQERMRATVMVRRLKADVLTELPPKLRNVVLLDVDSAEVQQVVDDENTTYERLNAAVEEAEAEVDRLRESDDEAAYEAAVQKLRTVRGILFSEMARVRHDTAVAKIPAVIEHLKSIEQGKVIVFAHHKDVVKALVKALADEGVVSITGETPGEARQVAVDAFQTDPKIRWFVGNIKAAGVGLTLTASSHVVFAELDWVPGNVSQAEDRAHRIGQTNTVLVQHLVLDGSLDAKMARTIVAKQKVIEQALDTENDLIEYGQPAPATAPGEKPKPLPEPEVSEAQMAAVMAALRILAGFDADHAQYQNDIGFNGADSAFGHALAQRDRLTKRQAAAAMKMVRKYRRQYPSDLYEAMFETAKEREAA